MVERASMLKASDGEHLWHRRRKASEAFDRAPSESFTVKTKCSANTHGQHEIQISNMLQKSE